MNTTPQPKLPQAETPTVRLLRQTYRNRSAQLGSLLLLFLILICLAAPLLTAADPNKINPSQTLRAPSLQYPMGTDGIGRDAFARFLYGGRLSLCWPSLIFFWRWPSSPFLAQVW